MYGDKVCVGTGMNHHVIIVLQILSYLLPPSTASLLTRTRLIWFIRFSSTISSSSIAVPLEFSSINKLKVKLLFLEWGLLKLKTLQVFVIDDLQFLIAWGSSNMVDITYRYELVWIRRCSRSYYQKQNEIWHTLLLT